VVDENPAHHLRGGPEEMCPIAPIDLPLVDEAKVDLVHERRRLQRLTRAFAPKERRGSPSELSVHSRDQLIPRLEVALVPGLQKRGDIYRPVHRRVEAIAFVQTA
jgi:hypothetical protein